MSKKILFMLCPLFFFSVALKAADTDNVRGAITVPETTKNGAFAASLANATEWLQLLDAQKYAESWDAASLTLKLTVPKNHWISLMDKIRKPYGTLISRKPADQRTAQNPRGLPQGDYMVILFISSFSSKETVNELMTLVLESDGNWRVLTYQVQ